jgi:hypothetical protein
VAIADRSIEFTDFVRPICLPMRPGNNIIWPPGFFFDNIPPRSKCWDFLTYYMR